MKEIKRADWAITLPKDVEWELWENESDGDHKLLYRLAAKRGNIHAGDRCFVIWRGRIRGWVTVHGLILKKDKSQCMGKILDPGYYLAGNKEFNKVNGLEMRGFCGLKRMSGFK